MPVTTYHDDYKGMANRWDRIEDAINGGHVVKEKKTKYLPELSGMNPAYAIDTEAVYSCAQNYETYISLARWYAAPGRTLGALLGLVSRRPLTYEVDENLEDVVKNDINGQGVGIVELSLQLIDGVLRTGRPLVLVDYDDRALIEFIPAASVVNWREINGEFSLLVIHSVTVEPDPKDEFNSIENHSFGVYRLEEGVATYQKYVEASPGSGNYIGEEKKVIKSRGRPLEFIPAKFVNLSEDQFKFDTPPIEPICDHAFLFYMISADRAWALHHVGLPTPYFTGIPPAQLPKGLGPSVMLGLPMGATAGMLTYAGEGLSEFTVELDAIKSEIADFGARLIESRGRAQEAQATVEMKMMSDSASLSIITHAVTRALTWALKLFHEMSGRPSEDVETSIDTDFVTLRMTGQELTALVDTYLKGAIPLEVFFNNLQEGQIVDQEMTLEEFERGLEEDQDKRDEQIAQMAGIDSQPNDGESNAQEQQSSQSVRRPEA